MEALADLGKGVLIDDLPAAVLRQDDRPRDVLGYETALDRHGTSRRRYTAADREDLHAAAQNAMHDAEHGATTARGRRLARRRATLALFE